MTKILTTVLSMSLFLMMGSMPSFASACDSHKDCHCAQKCTCGNAKNCNCSKKTTQ